MRKSPTAAAAASSSCTAARRRSRARPRTTVVHCHNTPPHSDTYDIYIGGGIGATHQRWGLDCPWRSPFTITGKANRTARQTAQNRHREWLHRPEQSALCARARRELRGLRLGCWCEQPGPCHGHNLCEVADADIDDDADGAAL